MRVKLGRLWGIAIDVDASWLVIFAVVTYSLGAQYFSVIFPELPASVNWSLAVASSLLFFGSVLLHELAHSVVAQRHGIEVEGISLFLFGGVARMRREPDDPISELKMALAGPGASLALAGVFGAAHWLLGGMGSSHPIGAASTYLALINVVVVLFNMVPGFPLDGGRVLRALVWWRTGNVGHATRVSAGIGQGFGGLLVAGGLAIAFLGGFFNGAWFVLVGWFLVDAARGASAQTLSQAALEGVPLSQVVAATDPGVEEGESIQRVVDTRLGYTATYPVPVVSDGQVRGLVGIAQVKGIARALWPSTPVREAMVPVAAYPAADAGHDAWATLLRMHDQSLDSLVVLEDGRFRGIVSPGRLLQFARRRREG